MSAARVFQTLTSSRVGDWLRLHADQSGQVYWVMSLEPIAMLYLSPAFESVWNMPAQSVLENPRLWLETVAADDRARVETLYGSLFKGDESRFDVSYRIVDGHGAVRWIRNAGVCTVGSNGEGRLALGIAEDATELHRSEHSMRRRAEWFGLVTEQAPIVLWTTDRKLRFTSSTGMGLKPLGLVPGELLGVSLFEYFQTQDPEFQPIKMHLRALHGDECRYEINWAERTYQSTVRPFCDTNGTVIGVIGSAYDITEIRQAEAAIQQSSNTYEMLIEHNPDLVALILDGRLVFVNSALQRMTGYSLEEMIGRSPVEFVIPEDRARAAERIIAVLSGDTPRPTEYQMRRKDGVLRTIEVLAQRIAYSGQPGLVAFIRDVTERRETEDQIRRRGEALERQVEERTAQIRVLESLRVESEKLAATGRMAARVAHEINNPLAGIKSAFRLIRDAVPADHPHAEFAGRIDREIDRIAHITQLMHRLYRPGEPETQLVPVDLCVKDVVSLVALAAQRKGITLSVGPIDCPPARLPIGYLEQILYNLLQNAIDASMPESMVDIACERRDESIHISVADRGHGIPADVKDHVFEPFFSTKAEGDPGGLGLGLSVTRNLAETAGGTIDFTDRPGGGTIFTVILPAEAA